MVHGSNPPTSGGNLSTPQGGTPQIPENWPAHFHQTRAWSPDTKHPSFRQSATQGGMWCPVQDWENGDFRFAKPAARSVMGVVGNAACPNVHLAPQCASHMGTSSKFGSFWAKWGAKMGSQMVSMSMRRINDPKCTKKSGQKPLKHTISFHDKGVVF